MKTVTLLDGGMGQELVRRSGKTPSPLWSAQIMLDMPEIVEQLHLDFIQAGSTVITVNAYSATPERLRLQGQAGKFDSIQAAAVAAALSAREKSGVEGVQIAGCLPPLVASFHPELAPPQESSMEHYRRIVAAQSPHVDFFLCETMASKSEAVYASIAALESGKPVWVALTLDDEKAACLRSGELWQEAVQAIQEIGVSAILLNCSRPETISEVWEEFVAGCDVPVGAYANGFRAVTALEPGGTVDSLEIRHDLGPETYAKFAMDWLAKGATLIGGCCEVGPAHIAHLRQELSKRSA
ncbi:MAG: S-methylmethionine-dependent homocysteine/selenocysteine methylase [bacterium]|jgi:S-methylmethionine-dependent homocysteine/selenocysteine methylase